MTVLFCRCGTVRRSHSCLVRTIKVFLIACQHGWIEMCGLPEGGKEAAHSSVVAPWLAGRAPPLDGIGRAQGQGGGGDCVRRAIGKSCCCPCRHFFPPSVAHIGEGKRSTMRWKYGWKKTRRGERTRNVAWVGRHRIRREAGWRKKRGSGRWRRKKARSMLSLSLSLFLGRGGERPPFYLFLSPPPRWWWWLVEAEGELLLPPQTLSASAGTLSGAAATLVRWSVGPMSRPLPPCGPDDGRRRRRRVGLSPSPSLAEKETE